MDMLLYLSLLILVVVAGASDGFSGVDRRVLAAEGKGGDKDNQPTKVPPPPLPVPVSNSAPVPPPPAKTEQPGEDASKSNGATSQKGQAGSGVPALAPPPPLDSVPPPPDSVPPPPASGPPPPALVPPPPPSSGLAGKSPKGTETGDNDKKDENSKGSGDSTDSGTKVNTGLEAGLECAGTSERCQIADDLVACLLRSDDSKKSFLLMQNRGENDLIVNIKAPVPIGVEKVTVAKHSAEKISVLSNVTEVVQITLNFGKGDCILQIRPSVSDWNPLQHFPAYAAQVTPIHGVYFLFFTMVIAGGTWACCKFGKKARRGGAGIPYRQLEMGTQPQSSSVLDDSNTTDGWEQSWDDDWDEEEAVSRPSERQPVGDTPTNGLTSKSRSKDGWDDDWDE